MSAVPEKEAAPTRLTLAGRAYEELRRAILEGRLSDEVSLAEDDLAESLGVSRTLVREALLRLEMEGFLTRDAAGRLVVYRLTAKEVENVFFLREVLEGYGARLAADRALDEEIDRLDSILSADFQASKRDQVQAMASLNKEFHRLIQTASRNRVLADLSFDLGSRIPALRAFVIGTPAQNRIFVEEHADILRLIREVRVMKPDARCASTFAGLET